MYAAQIPSGFALESTNHAAAQPSEKMQTPDPNADCMAKLPGDLADLLKEVRKLSDLVSKGQLTTDQAESILKDQLHKSVKNDETTERLVLLIASGVREKQQQESGLDSINKLTLGLPISAEQRSTIEAFVPPSELPKIVSEAKPHLETIRDAGIKINADGLDFSKADPKQLRSDRKLQAALDMVQPGVSESLASGKMTVIGNTYLLAPPHNVFKTKERFQAEIKDRVDLLHRDLMEYAQSSIKSASYWDMMQGQLTDRNIWWGDPDLKSPAQITQETSLDRINQHLKLLKEMYGMSNADQKPYYTALGEIAKKESEALSKTLKQLEVAKWTVVAAPAAYLFTPAMATSFLFGMGLTGADLAITAKIAQNHNGGSLLCQMAKASPDVIPTGAIMSAVFAPLAALKPLSLVRGSQVAADTINAVATRLPGGSQVALKAITPQMAEGAYRTGLKILGIPGLVMSGFGFKDAYAAHQAGKAALAAGDSGLAEQAFEERDHSVAQGTMGLVLSALPWFAGKGNLPKKEILPDAVVKEKIMNRYTDLGKSDIKATYTRNAAQFEKDFGEFVSLRDRTQGVDSSEFMSWWKTNYQRYVSDSYLKLLKGDHSFKELLEIAGNDFFMEVGQAQNSAWRQKFSWMFSPHAFATAVGGLGIAFTKKIWDSGVNAVTLAPIMRFVNAYTDAPMVPLESYLKQRGSKDFSGVALSIQNWINSGTEAKGRLHDMQTYLNKFREETSKTTDPGSQERIWKDFQSYYVKQFMIYGQTLPGNMRDGRSFMMGSELLDTVGLAGNMAGRYDTYLSQKRAYEDLQIRVSKGETLDPIEVDRMAEYKKDMARNLDSVAAILAVYKIRQFMYGRDILNPNSPATPSEVQLEGTFQKIADTMGYKVFNELVADRMEQIFTTYRGVFASADEQAVQALKTADRKK